MVSTTRHILRPVAALVIGLLPLTGHAQDRIGEIVQPVTGTDRAVYVPLNPPVILPRFIGNWATHASTCVKQPYTNRMELRPDIAIIAGHVFTVQEAFAESGPTRDEGDNLGTARAESHADADDMVVGLRRSEKDGMRHINFRFSHRTGRLILEEVGKPRRAYVHCS